MGKDQQPASVAPTIYNIVMDGTEIATVLQDGVDGNPSIKKIQIQCRTSAALSYGFLSGGAVYTLKADRTYWQDGLDARNLTLYLTGANGLVAEVEVWN